MLVVLLLVTTTTSFAQTTTVNTTTDSKSDVNSESRTIVISPPPSAISPSVGSSSSDLCTVGVSGAVQTQILGISTGEMIRDENCERLKISKTLYDMGMKVAAVSVLCQDRRVYDAMEMAGTPCPFEGKIGPEALEQWNKYDIERPDYDSYVSILENRSRIDEELAEIARQEEAERLRKEQEALAKKIAEEKAKLATLKAQEEVDNIIIETDLETKEQRIINVHGE